MSCLCRRLFRIDEVSPYNSAKLYTLKEEYSIDVGEEEGTVVSSFLLVLSSDPSHFTIGLLLHLLYDLFWSDKLSWTEQKRIVSLLGIE